MSASGGVMRLPRGGRTVWWTILGVALVLLVAVAAAVVLADFGKEPTGTDQRVEEEIVTAPLTWADRIAAMQDIAPRRRGP